MPLFNPSSAVSALYKDATILDFQVNPATGTMDTTAAVNDNNTATVTVADLGEYCEINLGEIMRIRRYRQFGSIVNVGDGRYSLQYHNVILDTWEDWITGIAERVTADWSDFVYGVPVYTDRIRFICTTAGSGGAGNSRLMELEVIN